MNGSAASGRCIWWPAARPCTRAWWAKHAIETLARVPAEVDIASEFRYRDPILQQGRPRYHHQPVGRDQRHAGGPASWPRAGACQVLAIVNVVGSSIARAARSTSLLHLRGAGDRRGLHQGLCRPAVRALPVCAPAGRMPGASWNEAETKRLTAELLRARGGRSSPAG